MTVTTLASFQDDYAAESRVELVSSRPPSFRDANTGIIQEAESAILGMNLSGALVKLIDNPGGVRGLLHRWDRYCRSRHTRWPDHAERPVCAELAWLTVRDRVNLQRAADRVGLSPERAARLLGAAIRQMSHWQVLDDRLTRSDSHDPEICQICREEAAG